jgi:hypothetical protein
MMQQEGFSVVLERPATQTWLTQQEKAEPTVLSPVLATYDKRLQTMKVHNLVSSPPTSSAQKLPETQCQEQPQSAQPKNQKNAHDFQIEGEIFTKEQLVHAKR